LTELIAERKREGKRRRERRERERRGTRSKGAPKNQDKNAKRERQIEQLSRTTESAAE